MNFGGDDGGSTAGGLSLDQAENAMARMRAEIQQEMMQGALCYMFRICLIAHLDRAGKRACKYAMGEALCNAMIGGSADIVFGIFFSSRAFYVS
jgi:hypothetical protein